MSCCGSGSCIWTSRIAPCSTSRPLCLARGSTKSFITSDATCGITPQPLHTTCSAPVSRSSSAACTTTPSRRSRSASWPRFPRKAAWKRYRPSIGARSSWKSATPSYPSPLTSQLSASTSSMPRPAARRRIRMSRMLRRAAFAALLALTAFGAARTAWGACADMGGGVGGTGAVARGGVGGTGISDTPTAIGVVGVITEFASVCVNGLEIHYDPGTPVTINGRSASAKQLAVGQVVAVEAQSAAGRLAARSIAVLRVLEGPVTRVDADAQTVFVMGQPVRVTGETAGAAQKQQLAELGPGTTVQVSGYRNARGEIVASRLDVTPLHEHSAIGRMTRRDPRTGQIGGLSVSLADARSQEERDVLVSGRWDGARLRASAVVEDPSMRLLGRVERAVVESLVREPRRGDSLRVGEHEVRIRSNTRIQGGADALRIDQRVRVIGAPDRERGIAAERIEIPRPGGGAERRPGAGSERSEKERTDSSGPGRPERIERDNSGSGRVERPERSDRSGSNSGRH